MAKTTDISYNDVAMLYISLIVTYITHPNAYQL